ncbi:MAG: MarR family transcriptional regulator [Myxococcota bacterium]
MMSLRLDDQLCFPLVAAARAVQAVYRPVLAELGLTYPQYLVLLVLWESDGQSVSALGQRLHLDSGTLTPLLQRLERSGLVRRERSQPDQRVVIVHLTPSGDALRERAACIPSQIVGALGSAPDVDLAAFKATLQRLTEALVMEPG